MNKRILRKKLRDALVRSEIHMLKSGFFTELQARREVRNTSSAVYRRRLRAAIRAVPKFPEVSKLDIIRNDTITLLAAARKNKINPGVTES